MGRKLILGLMLLSVALVGTTYAAVENIKVSGDINSEAVCNNFSLGHSGHTKDEVFAFSQIRLRFDADLTEGVSAVVGLINERIWGNEEADEGEGNTELALDLAYVELKEFLYEQVSLTIGRQNLKYGAGLIIGDPDTNQTAVSKVPGAISDLSLRKSFDAVKAVFDYKPYTLDLIFAKIKEHSLTKSDDATLFGGNLAYHWDSHHGVTEAYLFGVNKDVSVTSGLTDRKNKTYVAGARTHFEANDNIGVSLEGAYQFGDYRTNNYTHSKISAYAGQAHAEYKFLNDYDAEIGIGYTYLSGDDPNSKNYNGWNPLFEDQTPGELFNILFAHSNLQCISVAAGFVPREDLHLELEYYYVRLIQELTNPSYRPSGPAHSITYTMDTGKRDAGHEIDLIGVYDYTEDVQIKLVGGILLPGSIFDKVNDSTAYTVRAGVNVEF